MPQKQIQFSEAKKFAKDNGYIFAVYKLMGVDRQYHKVEDALWDTPINDNTEIMVKTTGAATDFNEFTTADMEYCFRLHNNFNVPDVIPVFV